MEVMLVFLLILFFILVVGFGIENIFKIFFLLIILGFLIYFLGWIVVKYFWIILFIWFVSKLFLNKNRGNGFIYLRIYRRIDDDFFNLYRSNGSFGLINRIYGGIFNSREEVEEFFRIFFGGGFG